MLRTSKKKKKNRTRVARFNFASGYSKKRNNIFWPQKWTKTFFIQLVYSFPLKYILLPVLKKIVQIGRFPAEIFYFETRGPFQPTVRRRLGWLRTDTRRQYFTDVLLYKVSNFSSPSYLREIFEKRQSGRSARESSR